MKKAIVLASALTLVGCSNMMPTSSSKSINPKADCITEVMRLDALGDEVGGDMFLEFLETQPNVVRTFVRGAQVNERLPQEWQEQFEDRYQAVYAENFLTACSVNDATVEMAATQAALVTDKWLEAFLQNLREGVENQGQRI